MAAASVSRPGPDLIGLVAGFLQRPLGGGPASAVAACAQLPPRRLRPEPASPPRHGWLLPGRRPAQHDDEREHGGQQPDRPDNERDCAAHGTPQSCSPAPAPGCDARGKPWSEGSCPPSAGRCVRGRCTQTRTGQSPAPGRGLARPGHGSAGPGPEAQHPGWPHPGGGASPGARDLSRKARGPKSRPGRGPAVLPGPAGPRSGARKPGLSARVSVPAWARHQSKSVTVSRSRAVFTRFIRMARSNTSLP